MDWRTEKRIDEQITLYIGSYSMSDHLYVKDAKKG